MEHKCSFLIENNKEGERLFITRCPITNRWYVWSEGGYAKFTLNIGYCPFCGEKLEMVEG